MSFKSYLPILDWAQNYNKSFFKNDFSAGLTVGIMLIPQGIAYALIAGLPPIYGLYTAMIPQIVYAIFGTSRQLAFGPVAMDSLIVAAGVSTLADVGTDNFVEFAILLATMMGFLQFIFGVFRLGFLVNFLSKPVISGFTSAASIIIGLNQLKNLTGMGLNRNNKLQNIVTDVFHHIGEIHIATLSIGIGSIVFIVLMKKFFKRLPAALFIVIIGILVVKFFHLDQYGVSIIGDIPKGLPSFKIPNFNLEIMEKLAPISFTLAFIAFLEAISVSKAVELKHDDYKIDPNQELIALGLSNFVGSFFQSYPATGGFSRTAVNDQAGARTPLAAIISAIVVALTLLFLTPLFYFLPKSVLAAIIIVAVFGLLDFSVPKQLIQYSKRDLLILNITLLVTLTVGIKEGILTGVLLSLGMLVYKNTKPHFAVLGKVPNSHFYRNRERFEDVIIHEEILIARFDSQLHFANTTFFKDKLQEFAEEKGNKLKAVIIDGESLSNLDSSAIYALKEILLYFKNKQVEVLFSGIKGPVRDIMHRAQIFKEVNYDHHFMSIQEAVDCFEQNCNNKVYEPTYGDYVTQSNEVEK